MLLLSLFLFCIRFLLLAYCLWATVHLPLPGKFIPHDDDFDYGVILDAPFEDDAAVHAALEKLMKKIRAQLPASYEVRGVLGPPRLKSSDN